MGSRSVKNRVMHILGGSDIEDIQSALAKVKAKDLLQPLFSGICRSDEIVRWNAIVCMGSAVKRLADQDMEEARIVMRRLLWSLNDESGGIGWGAPEALAEIMVRHDGLADEYIHMLLSYMREDGEESFQDGNYLENEMLQRGLMWGLTRLAAAKPQMLLARGAVIDLLPYLQAADATVRGLAAKCLGLLQSFEAVDQLQRLVDDDAFARFFWSGAVHSIRVAELASRALERISSRRES